ncbi:MAG TPA: serine hydrolase domain-containing protein [Pseudolabrys sp.]|nr:serine hydrolase domain-containing protein [Pseudolabrys sp.]
MARRILGIVVALACSLSGTAEATTNLKPFDPVALQGLVEATAKKLLLPGAMVLLRTSQGDFAFGYGATELGGTIPPGADTHFRAGSNTKTMMAVVILQLAQEGKIGLDDPVSKYIPRVPNGDEITISQLLKMRSGLYNYTDAPELSVSLDQDPTKAWTPEELLAIAFKRPPLFAPGTEYDYCNTNYTLLGLIAEKLEGAPLAKVFQDRLFEPLGMTHTLLPANASNTIPEPYSHGYLYGSSSYALVDTPYPADLQAAAKAGTLKPNDDTGQNPSYASAAGGVISTADNLATWMRALVGGKVLNADYQRQWFDSLQPQDPTKPLGQKYGYGISQITFGPNSVYFHGGEMPGYNSFMGYDPVNDVTLVIWTNLTVSLDGKPTANSIMLGMLDQIYTVSPLQ